MKSFSILPFLMWPLVTGADIGRLDVDHYCSFNAEQFPTQLTTFSSDSEAEDAISRIMQAIGLRPKFKVMAADVPNAAAVIKNRQRYILYNQLFMSDIRDITGTEWGAISILAHEIGHHLNSDTLEGTGSRRDIELEADVFSGNVLQKMGASLNDSVAAMKKVASLEGSKTHPPRRTRLAAITSGWKEAKEQSLGKTVERSIPKLKADFQREASLSFGPEMVSIPGGQYIIQCDPDHTYLYVMDGGGGEIDRQTCGRERIKVNLKSYKIAKNEITVGQYRQFLKDSGHKSSRSCSWSEHGFEQLDSHPVVCVSYFDTQKYIAWLNQLTGRDYRLPTSGEWEIAARARGDRSYPWGSHAKDGCKFSNSSDKSFAVNYKNPVRSFECDDGYAYTSPVGALMPNAYGLNDMFGNVREWLQDCYVDLPKSDLHKVKEICQKSSVRPEGTEKIYRRAAGGSWKGFQGSIVAGGSGESADKKERAIVSFNPQKDSIQFFMDSESNELAFMRAFFYRADDLNQGFFPTSQRSIDIGFRLAESL